MSRSSSSAPGPSVLWPGLLSPILAAVLGAGAYLGLTRLSANPDADYLYRLAAVTLVMLVPSAFVLWRFLQKRSRGSVAAADFVGVAVAVLALGLAVLPIQGAIRRARQAANLALSGVPAPEMVAQDPDGNTHRLSDHRGSVALVNIWATWCPPCQAEMPELDRIARERAEDGLVVFGISTEEEAVQAAFRRDVVGVDYPLLVPGKLDAEILPNIFTETARYPANFLIDREGLLHPAPSTDQPFAALEAAVEALLEDR